MSRLYSEESPFPPSTSQSMSDLDAVQPTLHTSTLHIPVTVRSSQGGNRRINTRKPVRVDSPVTGHRRRQASSQAQAERSQAQVLVSHCQVAVLLELSLCASAVRRFGRLHHGFIGWERESSRAQVTRGLETPSSVLRAREAPSLLPRSVPRPITRSGGHANHARRESSVVHTYICNVHLMSCMTILLL